MSKLNKPPILCNKKCKRGECHDYIPEANCYVFWCKETECGGIIGLASDNPTRKMISPISKKEWARLVGDAQSIIRCATNGG
jgi:hypothetical protein